MVGPVYTNPIVAVPMGGLSTISLNLPIGATFDNMPEDRQSVDGYTNPVRTEDLICPSWGLAGSFAGELPTIGPPYYPIIHPPSELLNLDPSWKYCTKWVQRMYIDGPYMFEIFDPPRALSPVAAMTPSTTLADPITPTPIETKSTVLPSAKPADSASPNLPEITAKPSLDPVQTIVAHPSSSPLVDPGQGAHSDPGRLLSNDVKTTATDAPQISSLVGSTSIVLQDPKISAGSELLSDNLTKPTTPTASEANPGPSQHTEQEIGPVIHSVLGGIVPARRPMSNDLSMPPAEGNENRQTTQGLGEIIYSAFGTPKSAESSENNGAINAIELPASHSARLIFTAGGSTITANPSSPISVGRTTISAGGPAVNIAGTLLSIGPSGLMIGSSIVPVQSAALDSTVVSAAGQAITISDPSAVTMGGTTLSVGGDPVTLAHTILSLAPSGKLMIKPEKGHNGESANTAISEASNLVSQGSSSIADIGSHNAMIATSAVFTVAGKAFTANPSAFSIDGTILSAGGAGIIISGTSISLASSGHLIIGSNTEILLGPSIFKVAGQTFTANPSAFSIDSTTLSTGGPGITISGTPITLGPSGNLIIGSSTHTLPQTPINTPSLSAFTIGGQTFIGNASALSVDGNTLLAGGAGVTISGTPISLEASGTLRVGSSDISLVTNGSFGQGRPEEFTGGQRRPAVPSAIVLLGAMVLVIGIIEVTAIWKR